MTIKNPNEQSLVESEVLCEELQELIKVLSNGQTILSAKKLSQLREDSYQIDGIFVGFVMREFTAHPEQVNWRVLMEGIEDLLSKNSNEETYFQHTVLETFSFAVANKRFDYKWLAPYIGLHSRKIINAIDGFWDRKSPAKLQKRWMYIV